MLIYVLLVFLLHKLSDKMNALTETFREKYADEYRALKEQMSTLPDRVSYDIMVRHVHCCAS